jgi:hypothetical protein
LDLYEALILLAILTKQSFQEISSDKIGDYGNCRT